mmetsp:Transcript_20544/g.33470  ORF Transcript_20544/g.33470 Transcript_20544/m.33470 type:complete len:614 (-) Transcript_20544:1598-3439(-)
MAFVHRTTRETCRIGGFTVPAECAARGPGHYDYVSGERKLRDRAQAKSKAPFSSTSRRKGPVDVKRTHTTPGPGSYKTEDVKVGTPAMGCNTAFRSRTARLDGRPDEKTYYPGPGSYDLQNLGLGVKKARVAQATVERQVKSSDLWVREPTAPSIPVGAQTYGYDIEGTGRLRQRRAQSAKQIRNAQGEGPGPGHYNPQEHVLSTKAASTKGPDISKYASRDTCRINPVSTPGPGEYDHDIQSISHERYVVNPALMEFIKPAQHSAFASKTKRGFFLQDNAKTPGPGSYKVSSPTCDNKPAYVSNHLGSTTKRFQEKQLDNDNPGPGAYTVTTSDFVNTWRGRCGGSRQNTRVKHVSSKKQERTKPLDGPGVGSYNIPGMADELKQKMSQVPKAKKKSSAFGSSSRRFSLKQASENQSLESALVSSLENGTDLSDSTFGARPSLREASRRQVGVLSSGGCKSVFLSRSKRSGDSIKKATQGPDPGAYETAQFHSIAASVSQAKRGKGMMSSKDQRFGTGSTNGREESHHERIGPGSYNTNNSSLRIGRAGRKQVFLSQSTRFQDGKSKEHKLTPGPGAYSHSSEASGFIKPTFNMSIAEQEELAILRQLRLKT